MKTERGSALLNAIIIAGIIAGIAGVMMTQTITTDKSSRAPRIRSTMAIVSSHVQLLATQPTSYTCVDPANLTTCKFNMTSLQAALNQTVTGAVCGTLQGNDKCGVNVNFNQGRDIGFDPANKLSFQIAVSYAGRETPIKDLVTTINVPPEVLQVVVNKQVCSSATPIFAGYDSNGQMICNALPVVCADGSSLKTQGVYISGVNDVTMTPICSILGGSVAGGGPCTGNSFLEQFSLGNNGTTGTCTGGKPDPFTAFSYTPPSATTEPTITVVKVSPSTSSTTTSTSSTTTSSSTTTTVAATNWNCYDGYAGGPAACNSGLSIVDDAGISGSNPGSAWIERTPDVSNGADDLHCRCSSGVKTPVSCNSALNREYWVCAGGSTVLPNCQFPGTEPGALCGYLSTYAPDGAWICRDTVGNITATYPCP